MVPVLLSLDRNFLSFGQEPGRAAVGSGPSCIGPELFPWAGTTALYGFPLQFGPKVLQFSPAMEFKGIIVNIR